MAKDPAFLFYPGDYLRDTQCLSEKAQVAYDRVMCEHMRNICKDMSKIGITKDKLNFFTKRLTDDEKTDLMNVLVKSGDIFQIEWVALSMCKRKAYSENRANNRRKKTKEDMKTYVHHMENENEIISNDLINDINEISNSIQGQKIEIKQPELFKSMMEIYKASFPAYFDDYEADYPSCMSIAQKTEKLKNWASNSALNGHMDEFLSFWREVVQYVANDDWLSSRSLRDLSTREWQRLGQHMSKPPKERLKRTKKDDNKSEYEKEIEAKREAARNKPIQE